MPSAAELISSPPDRPFPRGWLIPYAGGRWLLLATAALQAVAPVLVPFGGSSDDPPVVPAGYTFAIWGLIEVGCLGAALYGLPTRRATTAAYRSVHLRLSVVQVLFVAWLLAAVSPAVWLTVPIFVVMLVLTLAGLRRVLGVTSGSDGTSARTTRWLLGGTLGVYAGWSTAAVWVNVASLLPGLGLSPSGAVGAAWQSAFLLGACAAAVLVVRALAAPLPYVLTVAWAFVGIVVSALMATRPGLAAVALACLLVVVTISVSIRRTPAWAVRRAG